MEKLRFENTSLEGLTLVTPLYVPDSRGYLMKTFEKETFAAHGIVLSPWEELRSFSHRGVLRGLHFQRRHSQDKLVQVLLGGAFDVAVDLREGSPTFGKWEGFHLTGAGRQMLYIPKGFAHGFLVLEEGTLFSYLRGDRYDPASDDGIRWDDPQINVAWPLDQVERLIISDRDAALPTLAEYLEAAL